jgi:hypothetical protein
MAEEQVVANLCEFFELIETGDFFVLFLTRLPFRKIRICAMGFSRKTRTGSEGSWCMSKVARMRRIALGEVLLR